MRWFPVAFLTSGFFIVTRAGLRTQYPCVMNPHASSLHHGTTDHMSALLKCQRSRYAYSPSWMPTIHPNDSSSTMFLQIVYQQKGSTSFSDRGHLHSTMSLHRPLAKARRSQTEAETTLAPPCPTIFSVDVPSSFLVPSVKPSVLLPSMLPPF